MSRFGFAIFFAVILVLISSLDAKADYLDGVIVSYESGNQGTDMTVKTTDGRSHALWFDNMKKPLFLGKPLPWCPEFPCDGWPAQLILNKTLVRVYVLKQQVDGKLIMSPTRIVLEQK